MRALACTVEATKQSSTWGQFKALGAQAHDVPDPDESLPASKAADGAGEETV